jgi:hypothetical protein
MHIFEFDDGHYYRVSRQSSGRGVSASCGHRWR